MSDPMKCETCGKVGRRRMGHCCPEGWLYAEVVDEEAELSTSREGATLIITVCGDQCAKALWKPGPGRLDLTQGS